MKARNKQNAEKPSLIPDIERLGCSGFDTYSIKTSYCNFLRERSNGELVCTFPQYVNESTMPCAHRPKIACNCMPLAKIRCCFLLRYAHYRQSLGPWSCVYPDLPIMLDQDVIN